MKIKISARRSDLARLQAYQVGSALKRQHPHVIVEFFFKESLGDQNQNDPLWKMPERGVFTEDFVQDLLEGRTDMVVHSWKDLPTAERPGLSLAATLPRADSRDVFFLRPDALGKENLTLLTSSPRRTFSAQCHLATLLPFKTKSINTKPVRGNILTRLRKLGQGEGDGLFMAKAALDRMLSATEPEFAEAQKEFRELIKQFPWMVLPHSLFPTAPAQGALAVEIKSEREDLFELLSAIHDEHTALAVEAERDAFADFGGGCHQKIGISVVPHPRFGTIEFFHGHPDGEEPSRQITFENVPEELPSGSSFWPKNQTSTFRRVPVRDTKNPGGALFVSRNEGLPEEWPIAPDQVVWTAGTRTWQKLAERGIWVNGTSDGLGEAIPDLKALVPQPLKWTKLTHADSANDGLFPCLATYRLENSSDQPPPLVDAYFWASESLFRWALEKRPEIRQARHAAGPGYTASAIEKELGRSVDVYYNYAHWRNGNALGKD